MNLPAALVSIAAVVGSAPVLGQAAPFPATAPIEAAEAHGRAFPVRNEVPLLPRELRSGERDWVGSAERRCVDVPKESGVIVRSGEMIIGGILEHVTPDGRMKVWWKPLASSEEMTLSVVGQAIGSANVGVRYVTRGPVLASDPAHRRPDDLFFPGIMEFPSPGRWVVIGTSGAQWGCFVFDVAPSSHSGTGSLQQACTAVAGPLM